MSWRIVNRRITNAPELQLYRKCQARGEGIFARRRNPASPYQPHQRKCYQRSCSGAAKKIEDNNKVISDLKSTLETRDKKIEALENKIDDLEQYQRRQCLRIFGVAEEATEETEKIVMEVAQRIGVDVQPHDIDRSHRVGRRDISNNRPRPIIAKFVSYRKRSEMFSNKKRLKGSGVTLRDDLTAMRHNILKEAITKFGLNNVWTLDGTIIVNIDGTKRRVTRSCDLNM
ncbi:hypothetical protein ANN_19165 [Periplaneta americana]|uniref:UvrC family homology region profile domain-containing protein n=1 Tax=Periplaneta americana TaxID=6978 RepID=A0ABQ8S9F9_PERAM|nr:hypothetical protein ANN_19165 [Periplaneta americana]